MRNIQIVIDTLGRLARAQYQLLHDTWRRVRKLSGCRSCEPTYRAIGEAIQMVVASGRTDEIVPPGVAADWYWEFGKQVAAEAAAVNPWTPAQRSCLSSPPGLEQSVAGSHRLAYLNGVYLHAKLDRMAMLLNLRHPDAKCQPTVASVTSHLHQYQEMIVSRGKRRRC